MKVPFVDLVAQHEPLADELHTAFRNVLQRGAFVLGDEVQALEQELASELGVAHAVAVSSGTDALLVSLMALSVGPGDEVLTTPFSFFSTAGVIQRVGAKPVFVDIRDSDFLLDASQLSAAVTGRTRGLIAVHLFGDVCDVTALRKEAPGVPIVEDAAQAILASCGDGLRSSAGSSFAGSLGELACFSFFPTKNLAALGDGGLVTSTDAELAARVRRLRVHGAEEKYLHQEIGGNFRLDALQAAFLRVKLPHLRRYVASRQGNAEYYEKRFEEAQITTTSLGEAGLKLPPRHPGHVFNQYVVRCQQRDALQKHLKAAGIGTAVYYPRPLHLQPCFDYLGIKPGAFPVAERACREVLALPVAPELTATQRQYVAETVIAYFRKL